MPRAATRHAVTHIVTAVSEVAHLPGAALDSVEPRREAEARHRADEVARHACLVGGGGGRQDRRRREHAESREVRREEVEGEEGGEEGRANRVRVDVDGLVVDVWG